MQERKRLLVNHERELKEITRNARSNGHSLESKIAAAQKAVDETLTELKRIITEITNVGVEIKDVDMALVDFPSNREGRVVNLCWHVGEDDIAFWHETTTGFGNRQPL
jgi:hypothetical protein